MRILKRRLKMLLVSVLMTLGVTASAQAHLIVAQHGTVNIVQDGAFMVLSVPISAFSAVDEDGDGAVTMIEFNNQRAQIVESIRRNVVLSDDHGGLALEGILLSPEAAHDETGASPRIEQLTVMGRFTLVDPNAALSLFVGLYGATQAEQSLQVTGTRQAQGPEHVLVLTPLASGGELFPAWAIN